jgi:hypothetical protein
LVGYVLCTYQEYFAKLGDYQLCVFDNRCCGKTRCTYVNLRYAASPRQPHDWIEPQLRFISLYSTRLFAEDARDLLDHLGWHDSIHLVGLSMGAGHDTHTTRARAHTHITPNTTTHHTPHHTPHQTPHTHTHTRAPATTAYHSHAACICYYAVYRGHDCAGAGVARSQAIPFSHPRRNARGYALEFLFFLFRLLLSLSRHALTLSCTHTHDTNHHLTCHRRTDGDLAHLGLASPPVLRQSAKQRRGHTSSRLFFILYSLLFEK